MSLRITSEFFVAQLVRRIFAAGDFAVVRRKGASQAGAVFVIDRKRDGTLTFYAPADQSHAAEDGRRRFMAESEATAKGERAGLDEAALDARLTREARFDPDFWLVEIETATPGEFIEIVEPDED